ncbi:hypothetical protein LEP1GSC013_2911 [Leptospira interrogans serovar Valbuzzi str. Duyster]|nr:hypothetical protein LEP1GSC013_2911 [Leptospira interrogans serovar Valbuzzi str. Duyster]ENO70272.1 hypothetical protein LEP1GSC012_3834 [Leptospira interrogans serovar Valbuzzi str. Valbuzzi]
MIHFSEKSWHLNFTDRSPKMWELPQITILRTNSKIVGPILFFSSSYAELTSFRIRPKLIYFSLNLILLLQLNFGQALAFGRYKIQ